MDKYELSTMSTGQLYTELNRVTKRLEVQFSESARNYKAEIEVWIRKRMGISEEDAKKFAVQNPSHSEAWTP